MPPKSSPTKKVKKDRQISKKLEELDEDINTFLTTRNPYVSENCVEFDYQTESFKAVLDFRKPVLSYKSVGSSRRRLAGLYGVVYEEVDEEKGEEKMKNKFNFRSVATQTEILRPADQKEAVDPNLFPVLKFSGTVSKFEITEAYKNHEKQLEEKSKKEEWMKGDISLLLKQIGRKSIKFLDSHKYHLRLCERMLDQNMSEANIDFTYYDNPNDEFRPNFGSLLPLWSLSCFVSKNMSVSALSWNYCYSDLFAVGFKPSRTVFDDTEDDNLGVIQEKGFVCVYSLKGPSYPEKIIECPSAVCCIQFHQQLPHLLAIALTEGNLAVFDLRTKGEPSPVKYSKFEKIYHSDTIGEIHWFLDQLPQKLCSVSYDGKIINWSFLMSSLYPEKLITSLKLKDFPLEPPPMGLEMNLPTKREPKDSLVINTGGTTMSVNNSNSDLFLVGTVSGVMHKYSFDDQRLEDIYEGHGNTVSVVQWNPYHPKVFLSSGNDFAVKVWVDTQKQSLFEFFFESEVKDAAWSPFSSTLFAVIAGNSTVHIFDLGLNKREAIGRYEVYTAKQNIELTKVQFHPLKPIVIVGDERGYVVILKMSPNLRSSLNAMNTLEPSQFVSKEIEKMDNIIKVSKNPEM